MAENGETQSALRGVSKHPLFVFLLGTLIGSALVPYVNDRFPRSGPSEELRENIALTAVKNNNDVERRLTILINTFGFFWREIPKAKREDSKAELRAKVERVYREFDETAWWWIDDSRQQAKLLGLLSDREASEAKAIAARYDKSLKESDATLKSIWKISLCPCPSPSTEDALKALASAREGLEKDSVVRYHLTEKLTNLLRR